MGVSDGLDVSLKLIHVRVGATGDGAMALGGR